MTQDIKDVLKLALEALKLCTNDGMIPMYLNANQTAITVIEKALAQEKALQALHSENERLGLYKDAYAQPEQEPVQFKCTVIDDIHPNGIPLEQWASPPQRTEQNFCPRCGKRNKDIHTCTPPQD